MDDLIIKVVVRLAGVYENLGQRAYLDAGHRALLGIARAVQAEAERRAGTGKTEVQGPVIRFPLDRARRDTGKGRDDA
ncbi:MAG: hypothetical protein JWR51_4594 [Devosia sp.]|uniref:hypothetical protein n=1 Tax=Devosia sp. TaxID=1871048 RepID=UPI00261C531C|nr:hypothetical protein [Devosia sp.]MDB5531491.1 hypothetical protein [Devosia sp.]